MNRGFWWFVTQVNRGFWWFVTQVLLPVIAFVALTIAGLSVMRKIVGG